MAVNKYVICVEGQGEMIFIRRLLEELFGFSDISYECVELRGGDLNNVPHEHKPPNAKMFYLIINIGNDEKVLGFIKDSKEGLFKRGYRCIVGLRDMYSRAYRDLSGTIDEAVNQEFISAHNNTIAQLPNAGNISIFFAIMELESWILGMHDMLAKFDPQLTTKYIKQQLNIDLSTLNPEKTFFHPSIVLSKVLNLVGMNYTKSKGDMESIFSKYDSTDLLALLNGNTKSESFELFHNKICTLT